LAASGRLDPTDNPQEGTNVIPLQMTRKALSDGYVRLMADLYEPNAYFNRLDDLYMTGRIEIDRACRNYGAKHRWWRAARVAQNCLETFGLMVRLFIGVREGPLRMIYRRRFWRALRVRRSPAVIRVYAINCAIHYHMHRLVRALEARDHAVLNTF
jgi:hypothetical protein